MHRLLALTLLFGFAGNSNSEEKKTDANPKSVFPIGKETTYVDGPLDKDGYIDYESAFNERLNKGIDPEKNAAVLLFKALGPLDDNGKPLPPAYFKKLGIEPPPATGDYFIREAEYLKNRLKRTQAEVNAFYDTHFARQQNPWAAKEFPDIAAWVSANEKPLAIAIEATKRNAYYSPLVVLANEKEDSSIFGVSTPCQMRRREIAVGLSNRAMLNINEEKFDEAFEDLLAAHRLGRQMINRSTLLDNLVGCAFELQAIRGYPALIDRAKLGSKLAMQRLSTLQELPSLQSTAHQAILFERIHYLVAIQLYHRGKLSYVEPYTDGFFPKKPSTEESRALSQIDWTPIMRESNSWFDRIEDALRFQDHAKRLAALNKTLEELKNKFGTPDPDKRKEIAKLLLEKDGPNREAGFRMNGYELCEILQSIINVHAAFGRSEQMNRNIQIAFALAAYRADNSRYPAKLDDLSPKYLAKVPDDLFSDKPPIYKPEKEGYLLYSVGVNGKDEGGQWLDEKLSGDDLNVRMPLPVKKK